MIRNLLLIAASAALAGCASTGTTPLNPAITTADMDKISVETADDLKIRFGKPTRRSDAKFEVCKIWHYETKAARPFLGKLEKKDCYKPTTIRSMNFWVNSDGKVIKKELVGSYYVSNNCFINYNVEIRQMSAEELASPRIPLATGETRAEVEAYYKDLKK
jgi:hypothetical protein